MIVLIRHGKTMGNEHRRYVGSTDEPISERGAAGIAELKKMGIYPDVDIVFSSPMKRCIETAGIIYPDKNPVLIQDLREISFGEFEGLTHDEIIKKEGYQDFGKSPENMIFPGGENFEHFCKRCENAFAGLLQNESAAVIVHSGVIMSVMNGLFGKPGGSFFDFIADNGRGYLITKAGTDFERL